MANKIFPADASHALACWSRRKPYHPPPFLWFTLHMYVTYICILYPSILVSRFTLSNMYPYILFFFANSRLFLLCPNMCFPASGPQRINNVWKFGAYRYIHTYNTRVLQPFPRWFAAFLETTSKPVMVRPGRGLRYLSSAPALLSFFFYWSGHASSAPTCPMATYIVLSSTQCQGDTRIVLVQIVELDRRVWPKSQEGGHPIRKCLPFQIPQLN